jgi:hypothetical protein
MATMVLSADFVRYWSPRLLGLFAVGVLMLLASDAHQAGMDAAAARSAYLVHLIPAGIVLCVLLVAWRWELFGAVAFTLLGLLYFAATRGRFSLGAYLTISGTFILTGLLFLADWNQGRRHSAQR